MLFFPSLILHLFIAASSCSPVVSGNHEARQSSNTTSSSLIVDLGYGIYQGYYNSTSQLNIFKGIRYAAPPIDDLRWKKPQAPATNRSEIISATAYPPRCPQSNDAPRPATYNFTKSVLGSEDCLFLSIWTPPNATNLPVMLWIHGGGYGTGQGNIDFSELITTNSHSFLVVVIQYRLGAFGFLSSGDFAASGGIPNAGLYDMNFALGWVQENIGRFGGDAKRVTIAGESAGAGAVMLQTMAYNGTLGTSLFQNSIVASPYLPMQYDYDGPKPETTYQQFVSAVGCDTNGTESAFECLVGKDTLTLQNASAYVSAAGRYGQWAFLPVTDGEFLVKRPSEQLLAGEVNGLRILSGNNANEGIGFVPQNITTPAIFNKFTQSLFPLMNNSTLFSLQKTYTIASTTPGPRFSTLGTHGPSALNQSEFAIGQQQRANNLYAESTFVCPSYWLASAFSPSLSSSSSSEKQAWKYEYSVPPSEHGCDLDAYYAYNREALGEGTLSEGFRTAVKMIWGRFIVYNDPTLPSSLISSIVEFRNGTQTGDDLQAAESGVWPLWRIDDDDDTGEKYKMLRLNMTGGHETQVLWTSADGAVKFNVSQAAGQGLRADLAIVDAWRWEAGRGERCQFWADIGEFVPE